MEPTVATTGLDDLLDQLSESLTPEMAQLLVDFRANTRTIERMDLLAEKANDGTLTEAEQLEYAEAARAGTLIAILQAKAKKVLRDKSA